ncbi:MAG: phosphoribosylanthranilate isomerase [Desulfobacterales bacterium]|nr:phosphoribosylanthranilate isomerase [Desulfobacterales bacterium]
MNNDISPPISSHSVQIKICGITTISDAELCRKYGAHAIGFIFYPKSPRFVWPHTVKKICNYIADSLDTVGVFVNESFDTIMRQVEYCNLNTVQLHGTESPYLVTRLRYQGIKVIKALFTQRQPYPESAIQYDATAFLIECGRGTLPGGNATHWNWGSVKSFGQKRPLILAGGLNPKNVQSALEQANPDALDVSSGVEVFPGKKNPIAIEQFMRQTCQYQRYEPELRRIFHAI